MFVNFVNFNASFRSIIHSDLVTHAYTVIVYSVIFTVFRKCYMFHFSSYESPLTVGEGDVPHVRLRRGMSEEVRPTHTSNGA